MYCPTLSGRSKEDARMAEVSAPKFRPIVSFNISMDSTPGGPTGEFQDIVYAEIYGTIDMSGNPLPGFSVQLDTPSSDPNITSQIPKVEAVLNSMPGSSYEQFASYARRELSPTGKLMLLNCFNKLLYKYAYDETKKQDNISNGRVYEVASDLLADMIAGRGIESLDLMICGGISRFTVDLANKLGFEAKVGNQYNHFVAYVRADDNGWVIFDAKMLITGTNNFNEASSMYQAYVGKASLVNEIINSHGKILAYYPTHEGRTLLNFSNYRDPIAQSIDGMGRQGIPATYSYSVYNPLVSVMMDLSPEGGLSAWGMQLNPILYKRGDIGIKAFSGFSVFNSQGRCNFGSISDGATGNLGLEIVLGESDAYSHTLKLGYTRAGMNVYNFSMGPDELKRNNVNIVDGSYSEVRNFAIGDLKLKVGNTASELFIETSAEGEAGKDRNLFQKDLPYASLFIPWGRATFHLGAGLPMELVLAITQAENIEGHDAWRKAVMRYGGVFVAGASVGVGSGELYADAKYLTSPESDSIDIDLNLKKYLGWLGAELSFYNQRSNLRYYVPDENTIGFGLGAAKWQHFRIDANALYGIESWPGEEKDYFSAGLKFTYY